MATYCANCGDPLPVPSAHGGRRRVWCSEACRKRGGRARRLHLLEPVEELRGLELPPLPARPSADDQLVAVLLDLRGAAGALARLAPFVCPQLRYRCELAAAAIRASLDENLPSV